MRQFEHDWLELGRRVACSLHYSTPGTCDSSRQLRPSRPGRRTWSTTWALVPQARSVARAECRPPIPSGWAELP